MEELDISSFERAIASLNSILLRYQRDCGDIDIRDGVIQRYLTRWTEYRQKRNSTSHTYDEKVATKVMEIIPDFKNEAEYLLNRLKQNI